MTRPRRGGFIAALLRKNVLLLKTSPWKILFALCFPLAVVLTLGHFKSYAKTVNVPDGWPEIQGDDAVSNSLFKQSRSSPPVYYASESTTTALLLNLAVNGWLNRRHAANMSKSANVSCPHAAFGGNVSSDPKSPYAWPRECRDFIIPQKLAIAPDNAFTRDYFARLVSTWYPRVPLKFDQSLVSPSFADSVIFFPDSNSLDEYVSSPHYGINFTQPTVYAAIVFSSSPASAGAVGDLDYSIRMDPNVVSHTSSQAINPLQRSIDTSSYQKYASSGFMALQTLVTRFATCMPHPTTGVCSVASPGTSSPSLDAVLFDQIKQDSALSKVLSSYRKIIRQSFDPSKDIPSSSAQVLLRPLYFVPQAIGGAAVFPFPTLHYSFSTFYTLVSQLLGFFVLFSYMQMLSVVIVGLVGEKESKSRELMKILGVSDSAIVISWLLTFGSIAVLSGVGAGIAATNVLFVNSSFVMLFAFFTLVGLAVVCLGFTISAIFSKARLAAQVGIFAYFISYSLTSSQVAAGSPPLNKALASLSPAAAMNLGVSMLSNAESTGVGITFSTWKEPIDNFTFASLLGMLALDCVIFALLAAYLERVVPKEYGVAAPWYFPFCPPSWRHKSLDHAESEPLLASVVHDDNSIERVGSDLRRQEETGDALQIQNLRKAFPLSGGGVKVAVHGLNLTMYKNQITCLLGHNGAGKTTLISMLTGMIPPTSGDATVDGLSLTQDLDAIRASLGMCPQHNVLYPTLTVFQHLEFYGRIKGFQDPIALHREVEAKMAEVGLTDKRHTPTAELSGGMKRKLSLAIALLGDSRVVFLDEPTSGMDPYSRRRCWDVILNNRHNRVMVLTTHFMDEADILGDRIAIMADGELRCCGSSLFLKNRYGAGYTLSLVKISPESDVSALTSFIQQSMGGRATVLSNVGTEIAFQLPLDSSHLFSDMFTSLDGQLGDFGIVSYGISVTTLEEVFLKVAEIGSMEGAPYEPTQRRELKTTLRSPVSSVKFDPTNIPPLQLFSTQFGALVRKRFRVARRDKRLVLWGLLAPIAFIFLGIRSLSMAPVMQNDPAIPLTTAAYPRGDHTPVGFMCRSDWVCEGTALDLPHAKAFNIPVAVPVYPSSSPTVFNVTYDNVNTSGPTGFSLRLAQELWQRGYGVNGSEYVPGMYGGFLFMGSKQANLFGYNIAVNTTSVHAAIVYKAMADAAIYRSFTGKSLAVLDAPLPVTSSEKTTFSIVIAFSTAIFIVMAFAQYSAAIVPGLVHEKHPLHNAKHQQLVSGVSLTGFWLANYFVDLLLYAIPASASILLLVVFDVQQLTGSESSAPHSFSAVILAFVLFGFAIVPFCYLLSHLFTDPPSSQSASVFINMLLGLGLIITSLVLDQIPSTQELNGTLKYFYRLSPLFNLGNALYTLSMQAILNGFLSFLPNDDAFSLNVVGWDLIYLSINAVVYLILAIAIDYALTFPSIKSWFTRRSLPNASTSQEEQDSDVSAEARRVASGATTSDAVVLNALRKVYPDGTVGVESVSLGLPRGECFGYLGINGAGKTTTMKMLTGDIAPSSGRGTLGGFDILSEQLAVRRLIGYCPQFDALIDLLTVREHLELFAAIKGVPSIQVDAVVQEKLAQLQLEDFEDKLAQSLSGGTKRKLSVAMALIGAPPILFLDEPSTGMDPVSRRFMWDVLADVSTKSHESTILLTTHSMEECEALCTRVGIMVDGRLRCLGSIQHLKHKFGDGLLLHVKFEPIALKSVDAMVQKFFGDMKSTLNSSELREAFERLGCPSRMDYVSKTHPTGFVLADALEDKDGVVTVNDICTWWLGEDRYESMVAHLENVFGQVQLIERQNDVSRFQLTSVDKLALSTVFSTVEQAKASLGLQEYTISQTTLEQIFNTFAAQQKRIDTSS